MTWAQQTQTFDPQRVVLVAKCYTCDKARYHGRRRDIKRAWKVHKLKFPDHNVRFTTERG
jgi:hypothetical protein